MSKSNRENLVIDCQDAESRQRDEELLRIAIPKMQGILARTHKSANILLQVLAGEPEDLPLKVNHPLFTRVVAEALFKNIMSTGIPSWEQFRADLESIITKKIREEKSRKRCGFPYQRARSWILLDKQILYNVFSMCYHLPPQQSLYHVLVKIREDVNLLYNGEKIQFLYLGTLRRHESQ